MRRSISVKLSFSKRRDASLFAAAVILVVLVGGAGRAGAAEPWWHVNTVSAPALHPGGDGRLVLEVSDLGDAPVDAFNDPVTIVDTLPSGVTPTAVYGEGGGTENGQDDLKNFIGCSIAGQTVTCSYHGPLFGYERFMIAITVRVAAGAGTGVSEVAVSGGGVPPGSGATLPEPAVWRRHLALEPDASYGVENYELQPEEEGGAMDRQAGSHPFQLTSTLTFNSRAVPVFEAGQTLPEVQPLELTKDLRFDLPAGLIGNPQAQPKCSLSAFINPASNPEFPCPDATVIGVATPIITNVRGRTKVPLAQTRPLYNIEPAVGEPARFGFDTAVGPIVLDTSVRTGSDYGVVVTVPSILDDVGFIGSQVTFWGVPGDSRHDTSRGSCLDNHAGLPDGSEITRWEASCSEQAKQRPFLSMPTACSGVPLVTSVSGDPWSAPGQFATPKAFTFANNAGEPFNETGCNQLGFEPSISVAPDTQNASTPSGLTVDLHVNQEGALNPTGLAESSVKDVTVALPEGVSVNPAGADGLQACGESQVGFTGVDGTGTDLFTSTLPRPFCADASKIGTAKITLPILPNPLEGAIYLAEQNSNPFGSLIAMYIVVEDPVSGLLIKLAGDVTLSPTGRLVAVVRNSPQGPLEDAELHFFGGSRAPLGTPALCGPYTTAASIAPWSGNPPAQISSHFQITAGPNGGPCASPLPFAPSLTAGSSNLQAGAFTPFALTMSREDGNQNLDAIQLKMPPGLSGTLASVKLCPEAQANAGTCGPESLIGHTTVSVGLGGDPYTVTGGEVFITGPYEGAPFGLSIVNPAVAGPFNLGKVIVRAKIEVDPTTAALTITSDTTGPYAIPQYIQGIPLQIKHVNVTIDRPGFTFNPTNCTPASIGGSLTSSDSATSALNVPFQVTNCATLKFAPKFAVSTSGKTSKANGASLTAKLTYPKAPFGSQANIARVKVDLPKQLPSRLTTLQKACTAAQFNANPSGCPAASVIGHARAITPLVPVPLEGPAYFVSHGGEAFPSLIVVLQGYGVTIDLVGTTFISKQGITSSTFKTVPDAPVGSFELTLPQGKYSALAANGNLCKSKLQMPTEFLAQNGAKINESTKIAVTGCAKAKKVKKKTKRKANKRKKK